MAKGTGKPKQENNPGWPSKQEGNKSGGGRYNAEPKPKSGNTSPKSGKKEKG